jgi:hypothetical protein
MSGNWDLLRVAKRRRAEAFIKAGGGHIEHFLNTLCTRTTYFNFFQNKKLKTKLRGLSPPIDRLSLLGEVPANSNG